MADFQDFRMPEVSVISSWAVRVRNETPIERLATGDKALMEQLNQTALPGIDRALNEGIDVLDLYLLDHHEIPIYAGAAGLGSQWNDWKTKQDAQDTLRKGKVPSGRFATPAAFLASLHHLHLDKIADFLQARLAARYRGRGIGRRPRIAAIATHFPHISLSADLGTSKQSRRYLESLRQNSVKALRAALYLAKGLGAHCVEAVCGTKVAPPKPDYLLPPNECEKKRRQALRQSLEEVFQSPDGGSGGPALTACPPYLALEIEPGLPYLLSSVNDFLMLHQSLSKTVRENVGLNADLAHFFLIGLDKPLDLPKHLQTYIFRHIFHAHLSDHAGDASTGGVHASDLIPGSFHKFSKYKPWLHLLCEKTKTPYFSGVIAIEQEASFQIEDIVAARSIVQRWLDKCGEKTPRSAWEWAADWPHEGAFLVIDIGNSTDAFLGGSPSEKDSRAAAINLGTVIAALCDAVRAKGGSALNFTGDGLLILFEERLQPGKAAQKAAAFAQQAFSLIAENNAVAEMLTLRCGLHWGTCYIPTDGPLRDNGIGRDVVYAARLCSWLGETIEKAEPRRGESVLPVKSLQIGATNDFVNHYKPETPERPEGQWQKWGEASFKGLPAKIVHLWQPVRNA